MIPVRPLRDLSNRERTDLLKRPSVLSEANCKTASTIVEAVRRKGDAALRQFTKQYDGVTLDVLEIPRAEIDAAESKLTEQDRLALRSAYDSVIRYHREAVPKGFEIEPVPGITLGRLVTPFERAGLYIPGGRAMYPSSLMMAAAPADVAGVPERILCTPPDKHGTVSAPVLYVAKISGIQKVFRVGGAQAIAAMAYGTETIPACEIIVGPGNAFVTAAKKLVQEEVAIDFLAGPTEILIISDGETNASWIAAEMIAQAEHDPEARAIFLTTSESQASEVSEALAKQSPERSRDKIIQDAIRKNGKILLVESVEEALSFSNEYGPEHLTLSCRHPVSFLKRIRHAGAVFLGEYSPVATGDYGVGPNAILPTLGEARRRSGLNAGTFLKTISYEMLRPEGLEKVAPMAKTLARMEGLDAHLKSIEIRSPS